NIGSTKTEENLEKENGVFSNLGEAIFDDYWKNYGSIDYTDPLGESKKITNVWDYLDYRNKTSDFDKVGEGAKRKPKYFNKKKK
ncbi:type II restriction endonuclease, partial [Bacteroides heparinolyticus]